MIVELWAENNDFTPGSVKLHLDRYKHLLKWKSRESILEIGIADGKASSEALMPILPKDYKELVATDLSQDMVNYVEQHIKRERFQVLQQDIQNYSQEFEGRFDHVFGFYVIHMVKNPRLAFTNIYKMLKTGGQVFLTFFERIPMDEAIRALKNHPKWGKYGDMLSPYYYSTNPQQDYENDLKAAGFKDYIFEIEDMVHHFKDDKVREKLMTSVNQILPSIPEDEKEEYLKCFLKEVEKCSSLKFKMENGKRTSTLSGKVFIVIATKS